MASRRFSLLSPRPVLGAVALWALLGCSGLFGPGVEDRIVGHMYATTAGGMSVLGDEELTALNASTFEDITPKIMFYNTSVKFWHGGGGVADGTWELVEETEDRVVVELDLDKPYGNGKAVFTDDETELTMVLNYPVLSRGSGTGDNCIEYKGETICSGSLTPTPRNVQFEMEMEKHRSEF